MTQWLPVITKGEIGGPVPGNLRTKIWGVKIGGEIWELEGTRGEQGAMKRGQLNRPLQCIAYCAVLVSLVTLLDTPPV
jgi:hypothetical protein